MTDDDRIEQCRRELAEPLPHPDAAALHAMSDQVVDWVLHHFATLPDQFVGPLASRQQMEALLREPPPEEGTDFARVLDDFRERIAPYAFRVNHPRFFAFVPGAPTFLSVLGDWLCAGTNFFAGVWLEAAGPAEAELVVLDWFREFLGCPPETRGILTSGGSEANLTALLVAREGWAFEDRTRLVLYVGDQRHWSVDRAAEVIGLRPDQLCELPSGPDFRLDPAALNERVSRDRRAGWLPWAIAASGGTVATGAIDPLTALAEVCRDQRLWLHVDAAYGWAAVLTPEGRSALAGIERADSVTLDPHKWFGQAFEAGCVLVRDGRRLAQTFAQRPHYLQDVEPAEDEINFSDHGLALTRRFRALKIWLSVKVLGVGWFRDLVRRSCRMADLAEALLERAGNFEVVRPRGLSIICFRFRPGGLNRNREQDEQALDRLNQAVVEELRATGRAFISSTRLRGRVFLRFCFINWRTTARDVEEVVGLVTEISRRHRA